MFGRKRKKKAAPESANVIKHRAPASFDPPDEPQVYYDDIHAHFEKHIAPVQMVFHEIISDKVHLDILYSLVKMEDISFYAFVTAGMSDRPMTMPPGFPEPEKWNRSELCLTPPGDWPVGEEAWKDEENYWPIRWLKTLARLPHDYSTFIGPGHTVPNGDPPEPVAKTAGFEGFAVTQISIFGPEFVLMTARDGQQIMINTVVPVYASEMNHKLRNGGEALDELLANGGLGTVIVDRTRPPLI